MKRSTSIRALFIFGLVFLYFPLFILVLYSFNRSQLVTVWGGFSLHWYQVLAHDQALLNSAWLSIRLGVSAATLALILGTMVAVALTRFGPFRGKNFFYGMTLAPLVMPDIISGIALLLVFVGLKNFIHWPTVMSFPTMLIAHTTFCTAYASIVIRARLAGLDKNIEQAAMDLGAKPSKTFFFITLPQVFPSLLAAWLLSFTLSLDDLVITTFVSGPGSSTLPMLIFSQVKTGVTPEINALATVIIATVFVIIGASLLISGLSHSRKSLPK